MCTLSGRGRCCQTAGVFKLEETLGFMDENNECSKDHRGDGSLWFWGKSQPIGLGPRRWWGNGLEGDGGEIFGATTVRKPHTIIQHKIRGVS